MTTRALSRPLLFDVALVVVLLAVGVLQEFLVPVPAGGPFSRGGDVLGGATVAATLIPLLWRRRYPIWVMAAGLVMYFLRVFIGYQPSQALNVAQFVAVYSVGIYGVRPAADWARWIASAFVAGAFLLSYGLGRFPLTTVIVSFVTWVGVGVFGETIYIRRRYEEALEERARQLEADREERAQMAVQSERARIAREFHDIWAHTLSLVVVQANAAEEIFDKSPEFARQALSNIQQAGRQALAEVRRLIATDIAEASSLPLTPVPGIGELHRLVEDFGRAGVPVSLSLSGSVEDLPPGVGLSAYRIVQQALTNTLSHGGPGTTARVEVVKAEGELLIDILDDGPGLSVPSDPARRGRGLIGMRERAMLFGGDLVAGPRPEGGFAVRARIPLRVDQ